jgi:hypothetical protein
MVSKSGTACGFVDRRWNGGSCRCQQCNNNNYRRVKNCNEKESGKRILGLMTGGKKGVHFFGKGCCGKCTGIEQQRKKEIEKICQKLECQ